MYKRILIFLSLLVMVVVLFFWGGAAVDKPEIAGAIEDDTIKKAVMPEAHNEELSSLEARKNLNQASERQKTRFTAYPEVKLRRGEKQVLLFPEVKILKRDSIKGTVFPSSPLVNVSADLEGGLSMTEFTERAYEAHFNPQVIEDFLQSDAEFLTLPISNDKSVNVSVKKTFDRGTHTVTLFGNTAGNINNEVFLVVHDGVMYGTVHEVSPYRVYEYAMSGNGKVAIRHLDTKKNLYGSCEDPVVSNSTLPHPSSKELLHPALRGAQSSLAPEVMRDNETSSVLPEGMQASVNADGVANPVDLVITYLSSASTALGGASVTEAKIIGHVDSATQLFTNSQIFDTAFNLLGTGLETIATGGIVRPTEDADHNSLQDLLGADMSGKMYLGGGGSAWTPSGAYVYEGFQFGSSVGVNTASSFPHEICHNFGANHGFGDGGFNNDITTKRHYGWRFRIQGHNFRTVMSYTTNSTVGNNAANGYGPRIGYLSNPFQFYNATLNNGTLVAAALGATDGYNATSYQYADPSLISGGKLGTFTYSDNGSPGVYTSEAFTYTGGGNVTSAYNGVNPSLGANNNSVVSGRVGIHTANRTRTGYQFVEQPLTAYTSGQEVSFTAFSGTHNDTVRVDLFKDGVFVRAIDAASTAYLEEMKWLVPDAGLTSGGGYQFYITTANNQVITSNTFSLSITAGAVPSEDPVASYSFDEGQGVLLNDVSGNGHTAIVEGGKWTPLGRSGSALQIDADDPSAYKGVVIPSSAFDTVSDQISISFWTYGDASLPRYNSMVNGRGFNSHLPWIDGKIYFDSSGDRVVTSVLSESEYKNKWNHYVYTKNVSTGIMKIFVNGVERIKGTNKTGALPTSGTVRIGSANVGGAFAYDGFIDDVSIYNQALSAAKVADLFSDGAEKSTLQAYYKFDPGSELIDSSGNGHDATLNGAIWNIGGLSGSALEIDADSTVNNKGITIPGSAFSQVTDQVSISMWAYGESTLPMNTIVFNGRGYNSHLPWSNGLVFWDAGGDRAALVPSSAEYKNAWNHYVFTKDVNAGVMKVFINGQERGSATSKTGALPTTGDFYIGSANALGIFPYDGLIDEVRIYSEALSTVEVNKIFQEGATETDLLAYYSFDTGRELEDRSGNGHNATLKGALWNSSGISGSSLEIDAENPAANKGISIPASAFTEVTEELTIAFWTLGDASLPRQTSFFSGRGLGSHLPWVNGVAYWDSNGDRVSLSLSTAEYKGVWNHFAFTKNTLTGEMKIFVNGVERASGVSKLGGLSGSGALFIGSASGSGYFPYDGLVDEVRIYSSALSEERVNKLYNNRLNSDLVDLASLDSYDPNQAGVTTASGNAIVNTYGLEYVFGQPTEAPIQIGQPTVEESSVTFQFERRKGSAFNTQQTFQYSCELLAGWCDVPLDYPRDTRVQVLSNGEDTERVSITLDRTYFSAEKRGFFRFKLAPLEE